MTERCTECRAPNGSHFTYCSFHGGPEDTFHAIAIDDEEYTEAFDFAMAGDTVKAPTFDGKKTILEKAQEAVDGPRGFDYGRPEKNHGCTGKMFGDWVKRRQEAVDRKGGAYHEHEEAIAVCVFNICQKLSRLANSPDHLDSLVDIVGYARNWEMILDADA